MAYEQKLIAFLRETGRVTLSYLAAKCPKPSLSVPESYAAFVLARAELFEYYGEDVSVDLAPALRQMAANLRVAQEAQLRGGGQLGLPHQLASMIQLSGPLRPAAGRHIQQGLADPLQAGHHPGGGPGGGEPDQRVLEELFERDLVEFLTRQERAGTTLLFNGHPHICSYVPVKEYIYIL
eukprot:5804203-Pyramimonas_sp.AAC.1